MLFHNLLANRISLDGFWQLSLGETAGGEIAVPGCWEAHGYPMDLDGPAIYRQAVLIPTDWQDRRIILHFDAVSYSAKIWWNGKPAGEHLGMWTPFELDVTGLSLPGQENLLELEVYKPGGRYSVRSSLAGFLPDVATTFGGIWQPCQVLGLTAAFTDMLLDADYDTGALRLRGKAVTFGPGVCDSVKCEVLHEGQLVGSWSAALDAEGLFDTALTVPDPQHWSPQHPALYEMRAQMLRRGEIIATYAGRTGFRRLSADGSRLLLNGQPVFLRGALSWGWIPESIAPFYTAGQVREEFRKLRALGFNLVKLCLFIPNPVYFEIADEEGMLLWEEFPLWLPEVTPGLVAQAPGEYAAYMHLLRSHPSIVLYTLGCEMNASVGSELLGELNRIVRGLCRDVLVCDNSGSGESYGGLDFDFADFTDYHPYYDLHNFEPLLDNWRRDWKTPRPWIFGEFCDQDGFRDLGELVQANGGKKPWWMTPALPVASWRPEAVAITQAEERLELAAPGMPVRDLVWVAVQQARVVRKYTCEALRRRSGIGGYVITGLRDTPIATSGVLDDLGRPRWTVDEFKPFNSEAVLSLEVGRRRRWAYGGDQPSRIDPYNWYAGETANWTVVLHHTLPALAGGGHVEWRLTRLNGETITGGRIPAPGMLPAGEPLILASIPCALPLQPAAEELRLSVSYSTAPDVANTWPVWVYPVPAESPDAVALYDPAYAFDDQVDRLRLDRRVDSLTGLRPSEVLLTTVWDTAVQGYVRGGGRALFWQQGAGPLPAQRGPFWREALKLFPTHPLWGVFPVRGYADLQFFGLATDIYLDGKKLKETLPDLESFTPFMRRLDARSFEIHEYLAEIRSGSGKAVLTTLRFQGGAGYQPTGLLRNKAGRYLLASLLAYLGQE